MQEIRNFAIIAHIDHGKSTLADRLMELTGVVAAGSHEEQMLDRNPISRERGITIKLAPVRMKYTVISSKSKILSSKQYQNSNDSENSIASDEGSRESQKDYIFNLIDTPGHVDFSYEVDRTLACVEGVILLVDATKGIQAQTIANAYKALEKNLVIIPAVNKVDMPNAQVEKTKTALAQFLGCKEEEIHEISAKTGFGVPALLTEVVQKIPSPTLDVDPTPEKAQALIFDSYYDTHRGVIAFVKVVSGTFARGIKSKICSTSEPVDIMEVGIFTPDLIAQPELGVGDIGYIVTNLKDLRHVRVGDTITNIKSNLPSLPGYKQVRPMVYASMFTTDTADYLNFQKALEKLTLNDASLEYAPIFSQALGAGYRIGFLGLLHADVCRERLEREFGLDLVITPPQVEYEISESGDYSEPMVRILIVCPQDYLGAVMSLCENYRGEFITMDNKQQVEVSYKMPLSEMISDFFDKLKSVTSGFASLDWEILGFRPVKADKLTLLLNLQPVEEFSEVVVSDRADQKARELVARLKEVIERQQFDIKIQAQYKGRIVASERISAYRKDVLTHGSKTVGGGDFSRKRKLLEKQKEGKKRMKMIGNVEVSKEAFLKMFKKDN